QLTTLTTWALDRDPTLRVAYFDFQQDSILEFFLKLEPEAFQTLLLATTDAVHAQHPDRYKRFFPQAASHTILELSGCDTQPSNGIAVPEWTVDFLTGGPMWQDLVEPSRTSPRPVRASIGANEVRTPTTEHRSKAPGVNRARLN